MKYQTAVSAPSKKPCRRCLFREDSSNHQDYPHVLVVACEVTLFCSTIMMMVILPTSVHRPAGFQTPLPPRSYWMPPEPQNALPEPSCDVAPKGRVSQLRALVNSKLSIYFPCFLLLSKKKISVLLLLLI